MLETTVSGVTDLPFSTFLLLMQPVHLAIGVVEGLVTAAVVLFVYRAQPELLERAAARRSLRGLRLGPLVVAFAVAAVVAGVGLSRLASTRPDGLEWSIAGAEPGASGAAPAGPSAALVGALIVVAAIVLAGVVLHRHAARRRARAPG